MLRQIKLLTCLTAAVAAGSCAEQKKQYEMGTYGYDLAFFAKHNIETVELQSPDGNARVMLIPAYQGRVMTSTAAGEAGDSYGWINYKLIESGEINPQFNPTGGEERFWIGPEGGPNSYYFAKGAEQIYANWQVPAAIDTDTYEITEKSPNSVTFVRDFDARNASEVNFSIGVKRTVSLLGNAEVAEALGIAVPEGVQYIAYRSDNELTNRGAEAWSRQTGMPSVWLLGMFNPTPTTTVFIPYNKEFGGKIVNDEYFGKIPSDRLILDDGMLYFKIDGKCRTKLGLPAGSARDICGSYDSEKGVLTIVRYTLPAGEVDYVNGQWGEQADPFSGDVINSYNDGPTDDGTIMGPFYEIETSSPGAALAPGASLCHTQYTMHFQGDREQIASMVKTVFGVDLEQISERFRR